MWPSLRQPSVRIAASMILVLGCVGLIAAAETDFSLDLAVGRGLLGYRDAVGTLMDETTGSLGPIGAQRAAAALSDEDRFHIYEGVMRMPDAPVAQAPAPDVTEALPDEVAMQELPLSVLRRLPQVPGLKFAKFDDRIVVVNPASRIVVAMIPRYKLMP
jgi:hypothetical protein